MNALAQLPPNEQAESRVSDSLAGAGPARNTDRKDPRIGCAGIVRRGDQILLGRRDKEPAKGLWVLPGGGVAFGETLDQTLKREMFEETGIEIDVEGVFKVYELI